jgi:hypothetical protein
MFIHSQIPAGRIAELYSLVCLIFIAGKKRIESGNQANGFLGRSREVLHETAGASPNRIRKSRARVYLRIVFERALMKE